MIIETCGVFIFCGDELLICKAYKGGWSIPKGLKEPNESTQEAAIRETNVCLDGETLFPLSPSVYENRRKVLKSFYCELKIKPTNLKCNSFFGNNLPEVEEYKWVTVLEAKKRLHKSQVNVLNIENF